MAKKKNVRNHVNKICIEKEIDVWVLHELKQKNLIDRISNCPSPRNRNKNDANFGGSNHLQFKIRIEGC